MAAAFVVPNLKSVHITVHGEEAHHTDFMKWTSLQMEMRAPCTGNTLQ